MARLMRSMDCRNHRCALLLRLGALVLRDVAPDAPIAQKATVFVEDREPGHGHMARAAVRPWDGPARSRGTADARQASRGAGARLPRPARGTAPPSASCRFRSRGRGVEQGRGEILPREAMLGVGLPVHVEGQLHQRAKRSSLACSAFSRRLTLADVPGVRLLRHAVALHGSPAARREGCIPAKAILASFGGSVPRHPGNPDETDTERRPLPDDIGALLPTLPAWHEPEIT
jgi:hypothetical protein